MSALDQGDVYGGYVDISNRIGERTSKGLFRNDVSLYLILDKTEKKSFFAIS